MDKESEWVTVSADELIGETGQSSFTTVTEDDARIPETRMNNYFVKEIYNKSWKSFGIDNNLLHEKVNITFVSASANVTSVNIRVYEKHANKTTYYYGLRPGDSTGIFDIGAINGYEVWVQVNTGSVSASNPGVVTIFWTDRN